MRFRPLFCALVLALSAFAGPATAQNREHLQMNADLDILRELVQQNQLALNQLAERVKASEARIEGMATANVKGFADQKLVINDIVATLGTMRERLDENTTRVSQLSQEFTAIREGVRMLTDQLNALLAVLQPPVNPADPNAPPGAGSPLGAVTLPASPLSYFNQAMSDYQAGRFDLAIQGFKDVIAKFPTSPSAASAQFWIAESYYQKPGRENLREALAQYQKLIDEYKQSEDLPDAYLMRGVIYEDLKEPANARKMFETVIKLYPQSPKAIQAAQRLKRN